MDTKKIKELINKYNSTGRIAFYHPKQKRISLNGGRSLPESEAIKKMNECINTDIKNIKSLWLNGLSVEKIQLKVNAPINFINSVVESEIYHNSNDKKNEVI